MGVGVDQMLPCRVLQFNKPSMMEKVGRRFRQLFRIFKVFGFQFSVDYETMNILDVGDGRQYRKQSMPSMIESGG